LPVAFGSLRALRVGPNSHRSFAFGQWFDYGWAYGIRTIVSITPTDHERNLCRSNDFTLVEIPFQKEGGLSSEDLRRYLKTIKTGVGPFYVHCRGGTHRGGVLGVAYRIHIQGWTYEKALVEYGRLGGDLLADCKMLDSIRNTQR